jgi:RIO-like serine/threonine protein kinase
MSERIDLAEKTFEAFGRLHDAGIAHGDLSPRNVLVESENRIRFVDRPQCKYRRYQLRHGRGSPRDPFYSTCH